MQGLLTYSGILAMIIFSLFGQWMEKDEAESVAVAILTLVSACVAIYGRWRIRRAQYRASIDE